MGLDTKNPLVQIGITSAVCTIPALVSTAYRLWIRRNRFWADDAFAACSAIGSIFMCVGCFIHITGTAPHAVLLASYYMMAVPFYVIIWCARLSILFSITRMDPSARRRKILLGASGLFIILLVVFIAQLFWVCEPDPTWKQQPNPQCALTQQVVVLQLVTDIIADIILTVVPLRLIRHLKNKSLKRRLTWIFAACIVTSAVSLVHAAFIFTHSGPQEVIAAVVEVTISLLVCNIPVIVTHIIRVQDGRKNSSFSGPSNPRFSTREASAKQTTTFRWGKDLDSSESTGQTKVSVLRKVEVHHDTVEFELSDAKEREFEDSYDPDHMSKVKMQDV